MALSPMRVVIAGVDEFSTTFKKLDKELGVISSGFSAVGGLLSATVTAPLIGAAVAATSFATELNEGMANVSTLIPDNLARVEALKGGVQGLAIETGIATDDMSGGLYQVVSAFGDTEDTMGQLNVTARSARAGLASTTDSLNLLSAVTKGYGDTSEEAMEKAADLAFTTVKLGQTSFSELAASMGKVVSIAETLDVSQTELFATYATLTGVTGNAAEVSTQMSSVMSAMLQPSRELTATVRSLGYESASMMMKEEGLVGTLRKLNEVTDGNADAMATLMGRKEGLVAALALTGAQAEDFTVKMGAMENASGALDQAFENQTQGINAVGFQFEQAKMRIVVSLQKIGDKLLPILSQMLTAFEPVLDIIDQMGPKLTVAGIAFATLAAAIGPILLIVGQVISAFSAISGAIAGAGGAAALLSNPIGWIVLAIIGLVAVVIALWDELKPLRDMFAAQAMLLGQILAPALAMVKNLFGMFWGILKKVFLVLQPLLQIWFKFVTFLNAPILKGVVWIFQKWGEHLMWVWGVVGKLLDGLAGITGAIGKFFGIATDGANDLSEAMPDDATVDLNSTTNATGPDLAGLDNIGLGDTAPAGLGSMMGGAGEESRVTVDFRNVPTGTTVSREAGRVNIDSDNGLVMEDS